MLLADDIHVMDTALNFAPNICWVVVDVTQHHLTQLHRTSAESSNPQAPSVDSSQEVVTILSILKLLSRCSTLIQSHSIFASEFGRPMEQFVSQVHDDTNKAPIIHELSTRSELQLLRLLEEQRKV